MSRKAFRDLLERYLKGTCSPREQETVRQWYDLLHSEKNLELRDADFDEIEARLWHKINHKTTFYADKAEDKGKDDKSLPFKRPLLAIAVCMGLLLLTTWWINKGEDSVMDEPKFVKSTSNDVVTIANESDRSKLIVLPDSSIVELYKGAKIQHAIRFNENRKILLQGDALFDVKKNAQSPFIVYCEGMITRVLGTRFLIKGGEESGNSEVIVYTGKVEVIENNRRNLIEKMMSKPVRVNLSFNQRAIVHKDNHTICETIAERPMPLEAKQRFLEVGNFDEVPLHKLTRELRKIYGINIQVDPKVEHVTFSGNLDKLELFSLLEMICSVTETEYKVQGKDILIQ